MTLAESVFLAVGMYALAALAGAFFLPHLIAPHSFFTLLRAADQRELVARDRLFLPVTRIIVQRNVHPNVITVFGIGAVILLAVGFATGARPVSLFVIALIAALSDTFDGMVARRAGKVTSLGGTLDIFRDLLLFAVITTGLLYYGLLSSELFLWFLGGAVAVEVLKLIEAVRNRTIGGLSNSLAAKINGSEKLAIDRGKFFCYVTACLLLLVSGTPQSLLATAGKVFMVSAIGFTFFSVAAHGLRARFSHIIPS